MIARRKPIARKRATARRSSRVRDLPYMEFVRTLPCAMANLGRCWGRTEADHVGSRGLGQKCSDAETIPLCTSCHEARHALNGVFSGWSREALRAWCDYQIEKTQDAHTRWIEAGRVPFEGAL